MSTTVVDQTEPQAQTSERVELTRIAEQSGLAPNRTTAIVEAFVPFVAEAGLIVREAEGVTVTDATQVTQIKKSRELRLKLRAQRTGAENVRKGLKDDYLKVGQLIDRLANHVKGLIEPHERRLQEQEDFAERAEAARKKALQKERGDALKPYGVDPQFYQLGEMDETQWQQLLESSRIAHENKLAAEKRATEEKAEADRKAAEEAERLRAENERIRKEKEEEAAKAKKLAGRREECIKLGISPDAVDLANMGDAEYDALVASARESLAEAEAAAQRAREEAEAIAQAERDALEEQAEKERVAREKAEAELAAKKKAEEEAAAAQAKAEREARLAPDKIKLGRWAQRLREVAAPEVSDPEAQALVSSMARQLESICQGIESRAAQIGGVA